MAWKPDLESLFNDEAVTDNINNTILKKEKYFPPRPREHIEFALSKDKLREEKKKERKQKDEKPINKENADKKESEERKEHDMKKSKDRTFIFKLFDDYSKKFKHYSSSNTALPDILPREHMEFALSKDKLREEKEEESKQKDEKPINKENADKKESEERKEQDIKKSKDRTFIFKLFYDYSKKFKHYSSLNTALPDTLPEFPDLTLSEEKVVAGKEHNDCPEIENDVIQMMRTLGMGSGRASYLDANRTISTHPISSCTIFPTSQYGIPILMDEKFFKLSNTGKKENCLETVSDTNLLNSFEFKKRSFEEDPFAKAILENSTDDFNGKEAKEQYINQFPFLENTTSKVCNPERASESASAPLFYKNK